MVSILAQQAATAVLRDEAYRKETQLVINREKAFLERSFRKLGITFFPSDANFYLLQTASASLIWLRLRRKGIMVRSCSDFSGLGDAFIRIAVKSHRENAVLVRELSAILASGDSG
jgi:threonine-phosphate decarboxylase